MPTDPGLIKVGERRKVTALGCSHHLSPQQRPVLGCCRVAVKKLGGGRAD